MSWTKVKLGEILTESKVISEKPNPDRRITVRLKVLGVEKRGFENEVEGATKQYIRKAGQFIYGKQNFHKGAFGVIPTELDGFESSSDLPSFDVDKSCLPEFIFYFFKQGNFYLELSKIASGVATQRINTAQLFELELWLPNIKTQRHLISNIQSLENNGGAISTELTHQLTLVKKLRQQLLQDAIQGKLVAQNKKDEPASVLLKKIKAEKEKLIAAKKLKKDKELPPIKAEEIPFAIPDSWVWCRLGDLALYSESGKSYKCTEVPISGNEWGVLKVSAISWNNFLEDKNKLYSKNKPLDTSAKVNTGDFIISRANTSELVGKSVIVKNISKNLLLSDKTIRFIFTELVYSDYINLCNNSLFARVYYSAKGTGSSPSMKNITREHMKMLLIPLPSLHKQQQIVKKTNELMQYCNDLEASIKESAMQNEKLLQQVLREALRKEPVDA